MTSYAETRLRRHIVRIAPRAMLGPGAYVMTAIFLLLGFYILYPIALLFINSFNIAPAAAPPQYSFDNWRVAFTQPFIFESILNTVIVFALYTVISFPVAVVVAWVLGRTDIPAARWLEFGFWLSYFLPGLSTTFGWMLLLDPNYGMINDLITRTGLVDTGPFNIFSIPGVVWAHLMGNAISMKVMILTPAFRNMNVALEEAARVSGATKIITFFRVLIPVMTPPLVIVFMLNIVRLFQSFETEQLLGPTFDFYVYSTQIYRLVRVLSPPEYGQAAALASITLIVVAIIIPIQRWLTQRRSFVTVSGAYKPGLMKLGWARLPVFGSVSILVALLTVVPIATLALGTVMTRVGWWDLDPVFTWAHWTSLISDPMFRIGLRTTLILGITAAIGSPLLFSILAYVLVRTTWPGRAALDAIIWTSSAIPGILAGLGLLWMFAGTPFLRPIYGTIGPLMLVVIMQGMLLGVMLSKSTFLQMGKDMEEAARVSGAGWLRTYFRIWIPLLLPTLALLATMNFVTAASMTSTVILLANADTVTLSIVALEYAADGRQREVASAINLVIVLLTVGVAVFARSLGLRVGLHQR